SRVLNIPTYEIDTEIYWDPSDKYYEKIRNDKERDKLLKALIKKKKWILEGGYTASWANASLEKAELIILVWPPLWKRWYNITKRTLLKQTSKKQNLSGFFALLGWTKKWDKKRHKFDPYKKKIVEFKSADKAIAWVKEKYS
ncbi:hypothetical protein GOV10_05595, partial [Candidatus Woesearchaeota archaeon]|nr:hypothetical protein [Candidatus Woesearchaeota archaeon]